MIAPLTDLMLDDAARDAFEPRDPDTWRVRFLDSSGLPQQLARSETFEQAIAAAQRLHELGGDVVGIVGPNGYVRLWLMRSGTRQPDRVPPRHPEPTIPHPDRTNPERPVSGTVLDSYRYSSQPEPKFQLIGLLHSIVLQLAKWIWTREQQTALDALPHTQADQLEEACARVEPAFLRGPTGPDRRNKPR